MKRAVCVLVSANFLFSTPLGVVLTELASIQSRRNYLGSPGATEAGPRLFRRLVVSAAAVALLIADARAANAFSFFEPVQPPRPFEVMAHRGAAAQGPENTRPALVRCIEDGFEWAEVDVRLTKDLRHVLSHGSNLPAGTNESWAVSEHTLAELKEIDVGAAFAAKYAGERLLTFQECLALSKGKLNLYLDCKAVEPEQLVRDILDAGMERQVIVYDSAAQLRRIHEVAQGRVALMAKWHTNITIQPWVSSNHLAAVEIDANEITPEIARAFHELGGQG